jgi:hypothetical protein
MKSDTPPIQSDIDVRYDLLPPNALEALGKLAHEGAEKYGKEQASGLKSSWGNLKIIPIDSHVNHAVNHIVKWLIGDESEDHLTHAAFRLMVAKELQDASYAV